MMNVIVLDAGHGAVYNQYGIPVAGVTVNVYSPNLWPMQAYSKRLIASTVTAADGRWSFDGYVFARSSVYRLELISGPEKVEIEGTDIRVTVPPRPPRRNWFADLIYRIRLRGSQVQT